MSDKNKDKITLKVFFNRRTIDIQGKSDDLLSKYFDSFGSKYFLDGSDFEFYNDGKIIEGNKKYSEIFGIRNDAYISAEKVLKIIKCPLCDCNDCILNIDIDNYKLIFSGCKYDHTVEKLFDHYDNSQRIDYSTIKCALCQTNQSDDPSIFYKCLGCTKLANRTRYLCNTCKNKHLKSYKTHKIIKYDEKYYYCRHSKKYSKYCSTCNKVFCDDCDICKDKSIIRCDQITTPEKVKQQLEKLEKKINDVKSIVDNLKSYLDSSMAIIDKYYKTVSENLKKYELFNKKLGNYNNRIIKTIENFYTSNILFEKNLDEIINANTKDGINKLFDVYIKDRNNFLGANTTVEYTEENSDSGSEKKGGECKNNAQEKNNDKKSLTSQKGCSRHTHSKENKLNGK